MERTISLCMIVKNEEETLERCLSSVKSLVDEIIIVDTGSLDRTKEIAAKFTDKIYDFEWIDDFSAARNFSYSKATMDFILWLDADDIILPVDVLKFKELKENLSLDIDVVMMKYNTGFDSNGNVTFSCYRERLSRRNPDFKWMEPVHEYLDSGWKRLTSDIAITHNKPHGRQSKRNISIYETLLARGEKLSPRGTYYYARELKDHNRFKDAIAYFNEFLNSKLGWVEDNITACGEMSKCYLAENMPNEALNTLLKSFTYDTPRAEICCQIGYLFKNRSNFKQAIFWFELILNLEKPLNVWGFNSEDCHGFIPCIELAVCYDALKNHEKAFAYNEKAAQYKPDSQSVLFNKKYFSEKLQKDKL